MWQRALNVCYYLKTFCIFVLLFLGACGNCRPAWITQLDGFKSIIIVSKFTPSINKKTSEQNMPLSETNLS
jgi:hypothetical protein